MKKLISLITALSLCVSFCSCGKEDNNKDEISIPILETNEEKFNTVQAEVRNITQAYSAEGEYTYPYSNYVFVKKGGVIKAIHFNPSEPLKAGQLMIEFESEGFEELVEAQQNKVDEAQKNYDNLKKQGASKAKLDVAQNDIDIEKNALDKLNNQMDSYKVYAPSDGVIQMNRDASKLKVGDYVDDMYIGRIIDRSEKHLVATVYSTKLFGVDYGTKVNIAQGDVGFGTGIVEDMIFTERGEFSTYQYVIKVDGDKEFYDFGKVNITFCVYEKENVVTVPQDAVVNVGSRTFVYTLIDGIRIETDVEVGIRDDINKIFEIIIGLDGGETVIV